MLYYGEFISETGHRIRVEITTGGSKAQTVQIGAEDSGIYFAADDPATIESQVSDTFDHLLCNNATIKLLADRYIPDFYNADCADAAVTISQDGEIIFRGFVEPFSYNQGFVSNYEETDLNCIDVLSALQYRRWAGADAKGADYDSLRSSSDTASLKDILLSAINSVSSGMHILYDASKGLTADGVAKDLFSEVSLETLLFFGSDDGDVWTMQEVFEEILKYFNLHALQQGDNIYLFSWETLQSTADSITFYDISSGAKSVVNAPTHVIGPDNVRGTDAQISCCSVYSRLSIKDSVTKADELIYSPFDKDSLKSVYTGRQSYFSELLTALGGEYLGAQKAFLAGSATDAENSESYKASGSQAKLYLYFIQAYQNKFWHFRLGDGTLTDSLMTGYSQENVPNALREKRGCALLKVGKVNVMGTKEDDSEPSKIDSSTYLVIAVNGNGIVRDDSSSSLTAEPTEAQLKQMIPCARYTGSAAGSVLTPADNITTNYIVISGKIELCPLFEPSYPYSSGYPESSEAFVKALKPRKFSDSWGNGIIERRYYKHYNPSDLSATDTNRDAGLYFPCEEMPKLYAMKYNKYSQTDAKGVSEDFTAKVPVLQCMLIIGDKCLVETGAGTGEDPYVLSWKKYIPMDEIPGDTDAEKEENYYSQSFSIGFNPKIDDYLIGKEYDLTNTVTYRMNIDATGMAIPVKKSDGLKGKVQFLILGPVNWIYNDMLKRHKTMFRHTSWTDNDVALLSQVSNIVIRDFGIKLYTDNGLNIDDNSDLIYKSLTADGFVNKKDDIEFQLTSGLTKAECAKLNVSAGVWLSSPIADGSPLTSIFDVRKAESAKAEQDYIDSAYNEWHKPRLLLEVALTGDKTAPCPWAGKFTHPALSDKTFYVQACGRDLMAGTVNYTLKEIPL